MFITYPATPESSTLSLHDALPILTTRACAARRAGTGTSVTGSGTGVRGAGVRVPEGSTGRDRKSTRLNSSHVATSYAVFCLKKKKSLNETGMIYFSSDSVVSNIKE